LPKKEKETGKLLCLEKRNATGERACIHTFRKKGRKHRDAFVRKRNLVD